MPTTARDFITLALKEAGVIGVGQTALDEDINDSFTLMQRMLSQWQKRRWLVPMLIDIVTVGNSLKSNLIGPGQFYNTPRPAKIEAGWFIQLNSGGNPVSMPLRQIFSYEDYAYWVSVKDLNSFPYCFFYDGAFPYGNVYIWPIPSSIYQIHLLVRGAIGFLTEISAGSIVTAGSLYVNATYVAVPLTGGTGSGATADIVVGGGVVTTVTIVDGGNGYVTGDVLSASNANLGGAGSGFTWKVTNLTGTVDTEFNMPLEYEEAIHYNLAVRLCSAYNRQVKPSTSHLAKEALNTIRVSNAQISTLRMPTGLVKGKAFNIWNADAG